MKAIVIELVVAILLPGLPKLQDAQEHQKQCKCEELKQRIEALEKEVQILKRYAVLNQTKTFFPLAYLLKNSQQLKRISNSINFLKTIASKTYQKFRDNPQEFLKGIKALLKIIKKYMKPKQERILL